MTFGSNSAIFVQAMFNPILKNCWTTTGPTGYTNLSADTIKCALFNDTTTPDKVAAVASTGFNTGVWTQSPGNEVVGGGSPWVTGGPALSGKTFAIGTGTPPTNVVWFDAADAGGAGNVTITNAFGCLVYDDTITAGTVAKQGLCFNAFGSAQGVSGGTFTVVWDNTGVFKVTV